MGVYNPLVDMPDSCAECCFTCGGSNCFLHQKMAYPNVLHSRHPDCPLVEVKAPHGRLIDADVLMDEGMDIYHMDYFRGTMSGYSKQMIDCTPTVLEAEGKDDG